MATYLPGKTQLFMRTSIHVLLDLCLEEKKHGGLKVPKSSLLMS